jgi:hypothetical protein
MEQKTHLYSRNLRIFRVLLATAIFFSGNTQIDVAAFGESLQYAALE